MIYLNALRLDKDLPEGSYLKEIPAIRYLAESGLSFSSPVTFLIGENGSGKSTILEAIAVAMGMNPEGGSRHFSFSTYDSHSELGELLTTVKSTSPRDLFFLRAESFYNVSTYIEREVKDYYPDDDYHALSHGESFLKIISQRFYGNGLYLLDEPEAALSPQRCLSLLSLIHDLVSSNSQLIISTHSPILMAYPGACLYELNEEGIKKTDYRETEHYRLTKEFLEAPERFLRYLLDE